MSERCELRPTGLVVVDWDTKTRSYVERDEPQDPIVHLRTSCTITGGTTLGDMLRWIHTEPDLEHFLARYSWCQSLRAFCFESALEPDKPDDGSIEYLEVYWHATCHQGKDGSFDIGAGFHGVGKYVEDNPEVGIKKGDPTTWSVSYSPVNNLAHLPLRLNEEVKVHRFLKRSGIDVPLETRRCFSLLDVLDAILFDISFVGGPEDKVEFLEGIREKVDGIREEFGEPGD